MEVYWNFLALKSAKWKLIWKSPCWNFIIARNTTFVNTKREVFAKNLQLYFCKLSERWSLVIRSDFLSFVSKKQDFLCKIHIFFLFVHLCELTKAFCNGIIKWVELYEIVIC